MRTRDGYLWLGTLEGAVRFDGVRLTVFDSSNTPEFRRNWINVLLEDRQGSLWFGTNGGGLVRLIEGRFIRYGVEDGLGDTRITALLEDRGGGLIHGERQQQQPGDLVLEGPGWHQAARQHHDGHVELSVITDEPRETRARESLGPAPVDRS